MKKLFAASLLAFSAHSIALEPINVSCDFASEKGENITFTPLDPFSKFQNVNKEYKYWVNNRFKPQNIKEQDFAYRQAKLTTERFFRRLEPSNDPLVSPSYIRYYKAITENCETLWARVNEADENFHYYFNEQNHQVNGDLNWEETAHLFHIQMNTPTLMLHAWKNKKITFLPTTNNIKIKGHTINQTPALDFDFFEEVTLLDVLPNSFITNGKTISTIQLKVKRKNGDVLLTPWIPKDMTMKNPFSNKNIRKSYVNDIKNGNLRFGMNIDEVLLSWGRPDNTRKLDQYHKTKEKYQWIKDDEYPYAGDFKEYSSVKEIRRNKDSEYQVLTYKKRLPNGHKLIFDHKGLLFEKNQIKNINKNSLYTPVALPKK